MLYTVGEMARETGIPASTLRYYDKEGLLPFVERSAGGLRMFTDADREALTVIECLKRSGLSIREIREFMGMVSRGDESLGERKALFEARRDAVRDQIDQLDRTLAVLEYKCWYYETAEAAGTEAAVRDLPSDRVPERVRTGHGLLGYEEACQ
ncbi:MAG: MerR family transcriptional regulator [Atopobiaceae bacterium]|nr:MerR family transcriptional regulator [Atopobiaceae bacterium]